MPHHYSVISKCDSNGLLSYVGVENAKRYRSVSYQPAVHLFLSPLTEANDNDDDDDDNDKNNNNNNNNNNVFFFFKNASLQKL